MASADTKQKLVQSLNDLIKDISNRTSVVTTGVKIPELAESVNLSEDDFIIIESKDETKRVSIKMLAEYIKTL